MFNVGPAEVLMILVVALLVLGPKKLPEAAKQIGKAMTEFRRVTAGLQDEVRTVLDDHMEPTITAPSVFPPAIDATADRPPAVDVTETTDFVNPAPPEPVADETPVEPPPPAAPIA